MTSQYEIGTILPDMMVTDANNMPSTLSKQMGDAGLIIYVLRGTWCPFCVGQINTVRRRFPKYQKQGVNTVFIVPEASANVYSFALSSPNPLPFGLHADEKNEIAASLTFAVENPNDRPLGIYLIGQDRKVLWRFVGTEDDGYPSQQDLLDIIAHHLKVH